MDFNEMNITLLLEQPAGTEKAKELMIRALINTEAHHKQWYIERALEALGVDLEELRKEAGEDDGNEAYPWPEAIAP